MDRRTLGSFGMRVPAIGMGTLHSFDTDENRAPLVTEALQAGMDLFDCSPMYGKAEATLARAIAGRRELVIIATKVWATSEAEGKEQAARAVNLFGSIDIYQVHNLVAWQENL